MGTLLGHRFYLTSHIAARSRGRVCLPWHETAVTNQASETYQGKHGLLGVGLGSLYSGVLVDSITYGFVLEKTNLLAVYQSYTATDPVSSVTYASAVVTFIVILLMTRKHGFKVALLSAFVGVAAAPMIFELPFDLIVLNRIYPPIPPYPLLFRLLFFLPLFMIEVSTFSFITFSPLTELSRYTLFALAGVFFVFAVWAAFGFAYPSDLLDTAFNGISKVLSFITAITFFLGERCGELKERQALHQTRVLAARDFLF